MKKLFRTGFVAIALTFALGTLGVAESNAQMDQILKRMDANYKALKSLRTNVAYETFDSGIKVSDKKEGKAIYLPQKGKNAYFRIDWVKPEESLAVFDKEYMIYRPRLKQAIVGKTDKAKKDSSGVNGPLAFINMSKEQLRANFKMAILGEEKLSNGTVTWHLELTPKTAQKYKMAEIWVDSNGMPVQMKIVENNNDTSTALLSGYERNPLLKSSEFKIDLPKDTKIVKN